MDYKYIYYPRFFIETKNMNEYFLFPYQIRQIDNNISFTDNFLNNEYKSFHNSFDVTNEYLYLKQSEIIMDQDKKVLVFDNMDNVDDNLVSINKSFIFTDILNEEYDLHTFIDYNEADLLPKNKFYMMRYNQMNEFINLLYFNEYISDVQNISSNLANIHLTEYYTLENIYINMYDQLNEISKFVLDKLINKNEYYNWFEIE